MSSLDTWRHWRETSIANTIAYRAFHEAEAKAMKETGLHLTMEVAHLIPANISKPAGEANQRWRAARIAVVDFTGDDQVALAAKLHVALETSKIGWLGGRNFVADAIGDVLEAMLPNLPAEMAAELSAELRKAGAA